MAGFITEVLINPYVEVDRRRFPFTLPVFKDFQGLRMHPRVTFFVGENGSGKSTMIEAMAVRYGFSAEGGSTKHSFSTFDTHSDFSDNIILGRKEQPGDSLFLRAESFYNLATYLDTSDDVRPGRYGKLHTKSHGQGFLQTFSALKPHGLYLMDEPESALSIQGQLTFLTEMDRLVKEDCQLVIATHSPILLSYADSLIYKFTDDGINETTYQETDQYMLTLDFLKNRSRYARLLGIDELS